MKKQVRILTNHSGLGVYLPSLYIYEEIRERSHAELLFLEEYYLDEKRDNICRSVKKFQKSFRAALMAQKIIQDITRVFDREKTEALLQKWLREDISSFIVLSGFWIPLLEEYRALKADLEVHVVHTNGEISLSWQQYYKPGKGYRDIWLFNRETLSLDYRLPGTYDELLPWEDRSDRFIIHGGGWGIGTYKEIIPSLHEKGLSLDIFTAGEISQGLSKDGDRLFQIDPLWTPFERTWPPHFEITEQGVKDLKTREYPFVATLAGSSRGIISKPGGATLCDSLRGCVPLIFLDAYGPSEEANRDLWVQKGFGITYETWKESGFSHDLLFQCHKRLKEVAVKPEIYKGGV